jgi:DNA-directed RNA polymerase sigma subunit (sigma70/sigma32)
MTRGELSALGLDPRGIRQIEAKALRKLKASEPVVETAELLG